MTITTVPTFTATIYVGLVERMTGLGTPPSVAKSKIKEYVNAVGLCVTYTETEFIYTKGDGIVSRSGGEPGFIVGLINYPRFPSSPEQIKAHAIAIAEMLLKTCKQLKITVVMPTETVMISAPETTDSSVLEHSEIR